MVKLCYGVMMKWCYGVMVKQLNGETVKFWKGEIVKQIGGVNLLCVPIAQRTGGSMKNKTVFHLKPGSSTQYCVKGILHHIILNNNSLIPVILCWYNYYFLYI